MTTARPQNSHEVVRTEIPKPAPPVPVPPKIELEDQPLFSERHPVAFKASRVLLPRLGPLVILVWLLYAVVANLIRGDITFAYRWFKDNQLLWAFIHVVSSKTAFQEWFSEYGVLTIMTVVVSIMTLVVFHKFAWRLWFKDYIRFTEGVETEEGRTYWIEGWGFWFDLWDSRYERRANKRAVRAFVGAWVDRAKERGASKKAVEKVRQSALKEALRRIKEHPVYHPERKSITVYLKAKRWPPLPNPFNPGRSLWKNKLTAGSEERLEKRGPYELIVHEGKYRRIIGIRMFATHNDPYTSAKIPTMQAASIFKSRINQLINDTNELSKANVKVRLEKLRTGTVLVDPEIREMMIAERKEKART